MTRIIGQKEHVLHWCAYIFTLGHFWFDYLKAQHDILENNPALKQSLKKLVPGWTFLSRNKDISDAEWSSWKLYIQVSWFFTILHFMVSEILRKTNPSLVKYWYILSSISFVALFIGFSHILVILLQPILYGTIIYLGGKRISIWLASVALILTYNSIRTKFFFWNFFNNANKQSENVYLLLFAVAWSELRCISFSLDYIKKREQHALENTKVKNREYCGRVKNQKPFEFETLIDMFSYVLYLPMLYFGPIMLYEDFESSFKNDNQAKLIPRLKRFATDIVLFLIYSFIMELSMHYMYFYAMQGNMEAVRKLPCLGLIGAGIWVGFQFYLNYVISYGTTAALARLDNMAPPPTPRCIGRIHVYSLMWRYFDVGLYKFLVKYIYKPGYSAWAQYITLSKTTYRLVASFLTFCFIFVWHGTARNIFVWSALNYIGILLEHSARAISGTETYKKFKASVLKTDAMELRFAAFLCGPLLALSVISNIFLFGGSEGVVGDLFFGLLVGPALYNLFIVYVAVYCCCHVSMSLLNVQTRTTDMIPQKVK